MLPSFCLIAPRAITTTKVNRRTLDKEGASDTNRGCRAGQRKIELFLFLLFATLLYLYFI